MDSKKGHSAATQKLSNAFSPQAGLSVTLVQAKKNLANNPGKPVSVLCPENSAAAFQPTQQKHTEDLLLILELTSSKYIETLLKI